MVKLHFTFYKVTEIPHATFPLYADSWKMKIDSPYCTVFTVHNVFASGIFLHRISTCISSVATFCYKTNRKQNNWSWTAWRFFCGRSSMVSMSICANTASWVRMFTFWKIVNKKYDILHDGQWGSKTAVKMVLLWRAVRPFNMEEFFRVFSAVQSMFHADTLPGQYMCMCTKMCYVYIFTHVYIEREDRKVVEKKIQRRGDCEPAGLRQGRLMTDRCTDDR